jgi:hypothetical protein
MSLIDMFLALCKICNEHDRHLMDNMAVARFEKANRPAAMLCVEPIGDKFQLTMRAYHLGVSFVFPGMTKQGLISHWLLGTAIPYQAAAPEADFLFDAAFLRLMDDFMSRAEVTR